MALIKCPECGREISDKAEACIHCGCPASAMETKSVDTEALRETMQSFFDRSAAAQPAKTVPTEMPEMKLLPGILTQIVEKACGMAGCAGVLAFLATLVGLVRGDGLEPQGIGIAALGMGGAYVLALVLQAIKFHHAKRFLQKNGYEESICSDTPSLTNSMNAFRLYGSKAMARYIKRLNPVAGTALEDAMKNAGRKKRKEYLGHLPYLAVIAVIFVLIGNYGWMLPGDTACLIVMHLVTVAVLGVYGYRKGGAVGILVAAVAVFAVTLFALYLEDLWVHILYNAAAAFAGLVIGGKIRAKK